ncbi:MAG: ATP-binding cassette domain-containing protein [Proteobacteria bacterium]|nr:ATP-binding cassette domain-containing protein [Pseudomonadota bacterium]
MDDTKLIRCERVYKKFERFGRTCVALDDVSVEIRPKECVGFLGKSGSGKSTLIRCLLGIEKISSGKIFFENKSFSDFKPQDFYEFRQRVSWISQDHHLLSSKTVFENVALPLRLQNTDEKLIRQRVLEMLDYLGLGEKVDFFPSQLSGGQQQRVSIGRGLIRNPLVLFCDEPTSALDSETTQSIIELLSKIRKERSLTVALVTHNEVLARDFCQRIKRLSDGKVLDEVVLC